MPRRAQGFQLVRIVNTLTEVTGVLSTAIKKAGGEPIDDNALFSDLQDLVRRYGSDVTRPIASADTDEQAFEYNLAADLLTAAILEQHNGNNKTAVNVFANACQSNGIEQIVEAFQRYNEKAVADAGVDPSIQSDQSSEPATPSDGDSVDVETEPETKEKKPPVKDSEKDSQDDQSQETDDEEEDSEEGEVSEEEEEEDEDSEEGDDDEEEGDEEEDEEEDEDGDDVTSKLHRLTKRSKMATASGSEMIALANKISQRGDDPSLRMVRENIIK